MGRSQAPGGHAFHFDRQETYFTAYFETIRKSLLKGKRFMDSKRWKEFRVLQG